MTKCLGLLLGLRRGLRAPLLLPRGGLRALKKQKMLKFRLLGPSCPQLHASFAGRFSVGLRRLRFKMQCFRGAWVRHLGAHPRTFIDRNANRTPASVDDRVNLGNKKPLEAKVPGFSTCRVPRMLNSAIPWPHSRSISLNVCIHTHTHTHPTDCKSKNSTMPPPLRWSLEHLVTATGREAGHCRPHGHQFVLGRWT